MLWNIEFKDTWNIHSYIRFLQIFSPSRPVDISMKISKINAQEIVTKLKAGNIFTSYNQIIG